MGKLSKDFYNDVDAMDFLRKTNSFEIDQDEKTITQLSPNIIVTSDEWEAVAYLIGEWSYNLDKIEEDQ